MQKTVYNCDACEKEIGPKKHVTLNLGNNPATGIAFLVKDTNRWSVKNIYGFVHFCDGKCIGKYFDEKMKQIK